MTKNIVLFKIPAFIVLFFILFSCNKSLDVAPPIDQLTTTQVFTDDASAEAALLGLYIQTSGAVTTFYFENGGLTFYTGLTGDELVLNTSSASYSPYFQNQIPSSDFYLSNYMWLQAYKYIYSANALIENVQLSSGVSASMKNQITGEAKFIRALTNFYLFNLFGPIPLANTTNYQVNALLQRSDSTTVYAQIIQDLKDASDILPEAYPSDGKGRANKWTALALLNRVYLYTHDWNDAATGTGQVIGSGVYSLESLDNVFLAESQEAIIQFLPTYSDENTTEGFIFNPSSPTSIPSYGLSPFLLSAFESGDLRMNSWVDSSVISGKTYYYPYKYKVRTSSPPTEYYIVLRLAEQYLIQAEAFAQQGNLPQAITALDMIRQRAGLPLIADINPSISQNDLLVLIAHENQIEFFTEWGHRWFDLKRTGAIDAVMQVEKPTTWQTTDALFPIPNSEIMSNPNLTQNPGY
jgi:hypothetical protein